MQFDMTALISAGSAAIAAILIAVIQSRAQHNRVLLACFCARFLHDHLFLQQFITTIGDTQ